MFPKTGALYYHLSEIWVNIVCFIHFLYMNFRKISEHFLQKLIIENDTALRFNGKQEV